MNIENKNFDEDKTFEKIAKEGWNKMSSKTNMLNSLDRKYKTNRKNRLCYYSLTIIILFVLTFFLNLKINKTIKSKDKKNKVYAKGQSKFPKKIDSLNLIKLEERIKVSEIKQNFKDKKNIEKNSILIEEKEDIEQIKLKRIENIEIPLSGRKIQFNRASEVYFHNLLAIDYTKIRNRNKKINQEINTNSVSADLEKKEKQQFKLEVFETGKAYVDYLNRSLELFSKSEYKNALFRFETILENYGDDLNATFYGGLCFFNLGNNQKAEEYLIRCINHPFSNFRDDANWYLSKIYIQSNQVEKAKLILEDLISNSSYYSKQAKEVLKKF